ncbi:MAG: cytochrome c [Halieaceae bacterium]
MKKKFALVALLAGLTTAPLALSHLDPSAFLLSYRQSLFALLGANFGPMSSMIKGEMPWDDEAFKGYATDLSLVAELDFMRGFPPGSEGGRTRARPGIWENTADFEAKMADLKREALALAEASRSGDKKAILKQFQITGGTCKSCHDDYKSKDYLN